MYECWIIHTAFFCCMHACLHSVLTEQNLVLGSVLSMYGTPDFQSIIMCQNILLGFIYHHVSLLHLQIPQANRIYLENSLQVEGVWWSKIIWWYSKTWELKVGAIAITLRFLIRENQIREKSGNLIAKNAWPPCLSISRFWCKQPSMVDVS